MTYPGMDPTCPSSASLPAVLYFAFFFLKLGIQWSSHFLENSSTGSAGVQANIGFEAEKPLPNITKVEQFPRLRWGLRAWIEKVSPYLELELGRWIFLIFFLSVSVAFCHPGNLGRCGWPSTSSSQWAPFQRRCSRANRAAQTIPAAWSAWKFAPWSLTRLTRLELPTRPSMGM